MPRSFLLSRGIGHKKQVWVGYVPYFESLPVDLSGFLEESFQCAQGEKFVVEVISLLLPCRYFGRKADESNKHELVHLPGQAIRVCLACGKKEQLVLSRMQLWGVSRRWLVDE
ncbi:hypothetical protein J6590_083925 [Homalodisca vitripennis]|nr:hypothetical protein J6590_083925 [Homalodisca vitripennis]